MFASGVWYCALLCVSLVASALAISLAVLLGPLPLTGPRKVDSYYTSLFFRFLDYICVRATRPIVWAAAHIEIFRLPCSNKATTHDLGGIRLSTATAVSQDTHRVPRSPAVPRQPRDSCMHAYIHAFMHAYIHTYIHTYMPAGAKPAPRCAPCAPSASPRKRSPAPT